MKKCTLLVLLSVICNISFAQSKSITLTVKASMENSDWNNTKSELIMVDETNKSSTKILPNFFVKSEEHEKMVQEEINKITTRGYVLVNSSSIQFGGGLSKNVYFLITRYIFSEGGKSSN